MNRARPRSQPGCPPSATRPPGLGEPLLALTAGPGAAATLLPRGRLPALARRGPSLRSPTWCLCPLLLAARAGPGLARRGAAPAGSGHRANSAAHARLHLGRVWGGTRGQLLKASWGGTRSIFTQRQIPLASRGSHEPAPMAPCPDNYRAAPPALTQSLKTARAAPAAPPRHRAPSRGTERRALLGHGRGHLLVSAPRVFLVSPQSRRLPASAPTALPRPGGESQRHIRPRSGTGTACARPVAHRGTECPEPARTVGSSCWLH